MAKLSLNETPFDVDLVAFDKDGTLIDFYHLWGHKAQRCVDALMQQVEGSHELGAQLYKSLGYDTQTERAASDGPLATAPISKIKTIATTVLYQHGFSWDDAEKHVRDSFALGMDAIPTADLIQPLGDVAKLCRQLIQAGVQVAIVTTDDRAATEATLPLLGISEHVNAVVCGNDQMLTKPEPDAIWHLKAKLGVEPTRMMVVGDTVADMIMGTRAEVGCRVGVLTGVSDSATLAAHADIIIDSIKDINVIG
ncbi:MAG: HAD family hydrolase [Gammaproteobacteria bacterium]|jgi:phosphoglycolate phosphatase-like HAD superfamily hydrolase|nr:HAD family hydrolase [Gammaproteobacteria bacterium]